MDQFEAKRNVVTKYIKIKHFRLLNMSSNTSLNICLWRPIKSINHLLLVNIFTKSHENPWFGLVYKFPNFACKYSINVDWVFKTILGWFPSLLSFGQLSEIPIKFISTQLPFIVMYIRTFPCVYSLDSHELTVAHVSFAASIVVTFPSDWVFPVLVYMFSIST